MMILSATGQQHVDSYSHLYRQGLDVSALQAPPTGE